ncbi:MAG: alpha-galactosidase [Clostridia bacterium]|nr:alpha-galactosidase [Clostridia bacterium]
MKLNLLNKNFDLKIFDVDNFVVDFNLEQISGGFILTRKVKNPNSETLPFYGLKAELSGLYFGGEAKDDYYFANENARLFCNMTIPVDYNRLDDDCEENKIFSLPVSRKWNDPEVQEGKICSSPYQPFPAILLSNYSSKEGVVIGTLCQDVFYHSYEVGHKADGKAFVTVFSLFKDIAYREVAPGEELCDVFYIGETLFADNINKIFDNYVSELRKVLKNNIGKRQTNRHSLVWDSWNDGIYRDVSQSMLLNEAKAVKKYFPTVEWFQLDDGYSAYCEEDVDLDAHGLGVVYEGEDGIDKNKFPDGLKGYTDKIKELGLKPAVWIGGFCPVKTKIYREKPEWFIDYTFRIDWTQPLDVSLPEVREYMSNAIKTFTLKYGFEGIKHDFWSYAFEDRHDLLKNKDRSGYEYREWWQNEMRSALPEYGYLETGCDISMGNPFLGKYFNNYRFGLDVGAGKWENVKTTMFWSVAVLSPHTGDLYVPNSDSVGILANLSDDDFKFVVNWQIITRSLVEISGRFSKIAEDDPRLKILRRAVQYLNNGEKVYFVNYDYRRKGEVLPEIIYIDSSFDSDDKGFVTVALFNGEDFLKRIEFKLSDVGLEEGSKQVESVWENITEEKSEFVFDLKPHQSILLKIKK